MTPPKILEMNRPGELFEREGAAAGSVCCVSCAHRCVIPDGGHGRCYLRVCREGKLLVPKGYVSALACDPVEKKPFYHFLPGSQALSFGMLGCNFHCPFCQNWSISQTMRDPHASERFRRCEAQEIVQMGVRSGVRSVCSTYNEPLITTEWAVEIFRLARAAGMKTSYVSNGFASPEVLAYLFPWLDAMNVDLKCFREESYRALGGRLQPVLDTIRQLREEGKWVEVITLVVPGFNDSDEELRDIAEFLAGTDPDIPWHLSAYHADYRYADSVERWTPSETILRAMRIGTRAGLRFVYAGNLRSAGEGGNTHCPDCGTRLIRRTGFHLAENRLSSAGHCPNCNAEIPGVWD